MSVNKTKQIIEALEAAMSQNAGVRSVTVGDETIQFEDKLKLKELIDAYKRELAVACRGRKGLFVPMDLSSAW